MQLKFSTAYHPESDGQTERMNQGLECYLRMYCNYLQDDWPDLLPLAEFAYNNSTHSATQVSPFFANYGYNPHASISLDVSIPDPRAHDFAHDLSELHQYLQDELAVAQSQYRTPANRLRTPTPDEFAPGTRVWLNARNIRTTRPSKKLDHKRLGPFVIERKISDSAFRLALPRSMRFLHPVFHVSLLSLYRPNSIRNRTQPPPPPVEVDGQSEYEVAAILDSVRRGKKVLYRVQWSGYENTSEATTLEPLANLGNAQQMVADFHQRYPNKPR